MINSKTQIFTTQFLTTQFLTKLKTVLWSEQLDTLTTDEMLSLGHFVILQLFFLNQPNEKK